MKIVGYGHSTCIGLLLTECYGQETFCDVTLHCPGDDSNTEVFILRANSSVLAAAYPVFRTLLQGRCTETTDFHITIAGYRYEEVSSLLQFAYTGIVSSIKDATTQSVMKNFGVDVTKLKMESYVPLIQPVPTITTTASVPVDLQNKENNQTLQEIPLSQFKRVGGGPVLAVESLPPVEVDTRPVLINGNYVFRCHICSRTFKFIRGLETHMLGHNPNPKSSLQCKKCGAHFLNSGTLTRHDRVCSPENPLSYKCEICNSGFSTKDSVKKHMIRYHRKSPNPGSKQVQNCKCPVCGEVFTERAFLASHQRTVHGYLKKDGSNPGNGSSDEGEFQCTVCPRSFPASEQLNDHLLLHASGRLFECDVCSYAYDTIVNLNRHKPKHSLSYECTICSARFQSLVDKQDHDTFHHMEVQAEETV